MNREAGREAISERAVNIRPRHVSFQQCVDLVDGRMSPDEQTRVQAHLASCSHCQEDVRQLKRTIDLMRSDDSEDAPADIVSRAVRLFDRRHATPQPGFPERVRAALTFDSGRRAPAFGVRSSQTGARQLLFSAGQHDLDLRIESSGDGWIISGQLLGPCAEGAVELFGPSTTARSSLNDLCEFTLPRAPAGRYVVIVRLPDIEVEVGDIEVGE